MKSNKFSFEQLLSPSQQDLTDCAKLLDNMSQFHTDNVPEVFDYNRPTKTPEYISELLADGSNNQLWVARLNGRIVAVLHSSIKMSNTSPGWREHKKGYFEAMQTDPKFRQYGIASSLIELATEFFKGQNLPYIELNVWGFNTSAQHLYESLGFEVKNTNMWKKL